MTSKRKNKNDLQTVYRTICKMAGEEEIASNNLERLEHILELFSDMKREVGRSRRELKGVNARINNLLDVITALASLNYGKKATVEGKGDHIDALAVGLNMLGEEMQRSTVSLSEKEVLLKEIHHRVKNNLQLVCSLLNIQSSYISDPETLALFRESQNRVNSMSLIHEKLYTSKDFSKINFSDYINSIANYLSAVYNIDPMRIDVRIEIDPDSGFLPLDTALPCGLIVNELLSNSFKYAFPGDRKGRIEFRLTSIREKKKRKFSMQIMDDGVGLPPGMDVFKTESLGLQLVTTLVEQIDGSLLVESRHGTLFRITFHQ